MCLRAVCLVYLFSSFPATLAVTDKVSGRAMYWLALIKGIVVSLMKFHACTHPPTLTARSSASIALRMHSAEFSGAKHFDFFTVKLNEASLCVCTIMCVCVCVTCDSTFDLCRNCQDCLVVCYLDKQVRNNIYFIGIHWWFFRNWPDLILSLSSDCAFSQLNDAFCNHL